MLTKRQREALLFIQGEIRRGVRVLRPIPVDEVFKWCDEAKMLKPLNGN